MSNPAAPCTHTGKRFPKAWTLLCSTVAFYYVLASFLWERLTCDPQIRPLGAVWRSPLWNIQGSTLKLALTVTMHIVDKEEVVLFFPEAKTVLKAAWVSTSLFFPWNRPASHTERQTAQAVTQGSYCLYYVLTWFDLPSAPKSQAA